MVVRVIEEHPERDIGIVNSCPSLQLEKQLSLEVGLEPAEREACQRSLLRGSAIFEVV